MSRKDSLRSDYAAYNFTYKPEQLSWRWLVFLPFNIYWRVFLAVNGLIFSNIILFEEVFLRDIDTTQYSKSLTFITMFYIVDAILSLLHRVWLPVCNSMPYEPKSVLMLTVDFAALMPFRKFYGAPMFNANGDLNGAKIWTLNSCLWIYRVYYELFNLERQMTLPPLVVCIIKHNGLLLSLASSLSSFWYALGRSYKNNPESWLNAFDKSNSVVNKQSEGVMYVICFIYVFCLLNGVVTFNIQPKSTIETLIITIMLYAGFLLRYCYMLADTICSFLKCQGHMYVIKDQVAINKLWQERHLKESKTLIGSKVIEDFYVTYWKDWLGLSRCPLMDLFPPCLRKDVFTDMYWEALEHSHLLRYLATNMKRELSVVMGSKFIQPGDYIYRKGEIRNTFFYVANGVVQVMSHYDGVSPIITISSGSCLGSLALAVPSPCPTDVICAAVCELRYLTLKNYYDVLSMFKDAALMSDTTVRKHIAHVKRVYTLAKATSEINPTMKLYGVPQDDKLKWIKRRWRSIIALESPTIKVTESYVKSLEETMLPMDPGHTSKYLDSLVLSTEFKWHADTCCYKITFPYVLEPTCQFVRAWHLIVVVVVTIDCIVVPYYTAFKPSTLEVNIWDQLVFFTYIFDVYLQIATAVRTVEKTVTEPIALVRHHLKNLLFLLDILSAIPLRELSRRLGIYDNVISDYLVLNRLFKLVRVYTYFNYQCGLVTAKLIVTHATKYFYLFAMTTYMSACFSFIMACHFVGKDLICSENSWFISFTKLSDSTINIARLYLLSSVIYVGELINACGVVQFSNVLLSNAIFSSLVALLAKNILTFTYAEVVAMWIMTGSRRLSYGDVVTTVKSIIQEKHVHEALTYIITKYLNIQWTNNYAIDFDPLPLNEVLSPALMAERNKIINSHLKSIQYFEGLSENTIKKIENLCKIYTVPKGYIFCRAGEIPSSFNILLDGVCNLTSMLKIDMLKYPRGRIVRSGQSFPLLEILQNIECLQTTVSLTACNVITIDAEKLKGIIFGKFRLLQDIREATTDSPGRLDVVISKMKYRTTKIKESNFLPVIGKKEKSKKKKKKRVSFFKRIRLLCHCPYMVNPKGDFIYIWEGLKVLQVSATVLYVPAMLLFLCNERYFTYIIALILDAFSFIDIFVRFHSGVYNKQGLIIFEKSYYFSHAFTVDFISSLPTYLILYDYDFKAKFYITLMSKLLQIYRVSGFFYALNYKYSISDIKITLMNFVYHVLLIVYCIATALFCYSCVVECNMGEYKLSHLKGSWVESNELYVIDNRLSLMLSSLFLATALLTGSETGYFSVTTLEEIKCLLLLTVLTCMIKCYYLPKITAQLIGYNHFTQHREKILQFYRFIRNEGADYAIANRIVQHCSYTYLKLKGVNLPQLLQTIHPTIRSDLLFAMYYKGTTCLHEFVGESKSFMKILTRELTEIHYLKGAIVLNYDELNSKVYFVCEGTIEVINNYDEQVTILKPGSMFGALGISGKKRQKYTFINLINAYLLTIDGQTFVKLFQIHDKENAANFFKQTEGLEYFSAERNKKRNYETIEPVVVQDYSLLHEDSIFYQHVMFILSMIVPYLSMYPLFFVMLFEDRVKMHGLYAVIYIFDVIMCFRIGIGLTATYADKKTGLNVTDQKQIMVMYLSKPTGFALDFLSTLPFEIIFLIFTSKLFNILMLNRVLRLIMIFIYVWEYNDKVFISSWMRWFSFIIQMTLGVYVVTIVWLYFTYEFGPESKLVTSPSTIFIEGLKDTIILVTFSSSNLFHLPTLNMHCVVMAVVGVLAFSYFPFMISGFSRKYQSGNYSKKVYEYKLYCVKLYLQMRDLSSSLLEQLWNYSLLLWTSNNGQYYPDYLIEAPANLKCELLMDLYGGHIRYNVLFENCNSMFNFQLSGRLKRTVYFPGDVIIRKFDVDNTMYFMNSGEVEAVEYDELNTEIVEDVFITGQCFGLAQGLKERMPHMSTYKARNTVELLSLNRLDYLDLLMAFPEDKRRIYRQAEMVGILEF